MLKKYIKEMIKSVFKIEIGKSGKDILLLSQRENDNYHAKQIYKFLGDMELKRILKQYGINLVLDVGANQGQFASYLRSSIGYKGNIISFEPIKNVCKQLSECAAGDPLWDTYNIALGDHDGEQTINVTAVSEFSSFLEANEYSRRFGDSSLMAHQENVQTKRIDTFFKENIGDHSGLKILLKMDTQGYDLKVFSGLGEVIESVAALQSEISVVPIYDGMPHLTESVACFEKAGFGIVGLFPVSREKSLRIIEYDCLMVKTI